MPRTATQMVCPACGVVSPCDTRTAAEVNNSGGDFADSRSGRFVYDSDPPISYYRRIRECGNLSCGVYFETAELDEGLLHELDQLRERVRDARVEGAVAEAHTATTQEALGRLRRALDVE